MSFPKEFNAKDLKSGKILEFSNESWCEQTQSDDIREGEVCFNESTNKFNIWFNGTIIFASEHMGNVKNRLKKLLVKWKLEFKNW